MKRGETGTPRKDVPTSLPLNVPAHGTKGRTQLVNPSERGGERDEAGGGEGFGDVDDVLGGEAAAAGEEGKERGK